MIRACINVTTVRAGLRPALWGEWGSTDYATSVLCNSYSNSYYNLYKEKHQHYCKPKLEVDNSILQWPLPLYAEQVVNKQLLNTGAN